MSSRLFVYRSGVPSIGWTATLPVQGQVGRATQQHHHTVGAVEGWGTILVAQSSLPVHRYYSRLLLSTVKDVYRGRVRTITRPAARPVPGQAGRDPQPTQPTAGAVEG